MGEHLLGGEQESKLRKREKMNQEAREKEKKQRDKNPISNP